MKSLSVPVAEFPIKITYQGSEWQNWLDYFILYRDVSKKGLFSAEFCFFDPCLNILAESFYNVNYGSSIITSKVSQKISVNTGVSVVFKTKRELKCQNKLFFWKHQFFCFHYWEVLTRFLT